MGAHTPFTPCRISMACLIVVIGMLFIFQNQATSVLKAVHQDVCEKQQHAHESPWTLRTFPLVTPLEELGPEGDEAWEGLTTEHGGFLWLQYNETFEIPWGISMFHGMHCLQMLRSEFQSQLGLSSGGRHHHHHRRNIATKHDQHNDSVDLIHLGHCLAYIAEMLACVGDSTIEQPWVKVDETTGEIAHYGVDGAGMQHQCRDTSHLWQAAEETEQIAAPAWDHKPGETVEDVFGNLKVQGNDII